jgi:hypothetical protein
MNKLLIGLLIIAAGTAGYFVFLRKNTNNEPGVNLNKSILGKWKQNDSTRHYEFLADGLIIRPGTDSLPADTAYYQWDNAGAFVWKPDTSGTRDIPYEVTRLTTDSLVLQSADSTWTIFTKIR